MADNTTLNSGTGGDTIASDDIGGVKHQRVKLSVGADGAANDCIPVSAGLDTTAAGVPAVGIVGQFDDTAPAAVTENQFAPVRISSRRALLVEGVASGTVIPVSDGGGSLTVDGSVGITGTVTVDGSGVTQPVSNAGLTALNGAIAGTEVQVDVVSSALPTGAATAANQSTANTALAAIQTATELLDNAVRAEDEASAGGHSGLVVLARRTDTPAAQSGTDGDYEFLQVTGGRLAVQATGSGTFTVDGSGVTQPVSHAGLTALNGAIAGTEVQVDVVAALPAGDNNIGNVDIVTMPNVTLAAGTNTNEVVGDAAHDAPVAGNPLLVAAEARSTDGTAVASGDVVRQLATLLGKGVNYPYALPGSTWGYAAASGGITDTTGVTAKAAAGAGVRNYITRVQVINGHATVSTDVQIRDGASGTVLWRGFAQAAGGGVSAVFDPPLRGTANTLVEVACGTTGTATYFNLQGFTAAE
jgi:hypothetical protein